MPSLDPPIPPGMGSPSLSRRQVWIALVATTLLLLSVAGVWSWLAQVPSLPLQFEGSSILLGVLWGLGITAISQAIYRLWPAYQAVAKVYMTLVIEPLTWADVIWIGVLPGVTEEILFRGVALAALGTSPQMILLTSLVFGALHVLDLRFWTYGIWATGVGILMSISFVVTGNLLVPITAHMVTNILAGYTWKRHLVGRRSGPSPGSW